VTLLGLTLAQAIKDRARQLGFDRVGIGPASPRRAAEFERWLDAGYAGTMTYLHRTRSERADPTRLLPGVRSLVAVAATYNPGARDDGDWAPVARYARGADYHDVLRPRLVSLAKFIDETAGAQTRSRAAVDTSAVLERDLAARAGLGWIGKNTNVLSEDLGSYFFIGVVLTTALLAYDGEQPDRCGTCTACLDACPTNAFVGPYVLDARRCLSYLTIEHRGPIAAELRPALGDWIFGCDVCQEVCPWNRKAAEARDPALKPPQPLGPIARLMELDEKAFRDRFRKTALWRSRRAGLVRNVALSLGCRRDATAMDALQRATHDPDPVVRDAAAWAMGEVGRR
jgi:epoxyqueuosine reductase